MPTSYKLATEILLCIYGQWKHAQEILLVDVLVNDT